MSVVIETTLGDITVDLFLYDRPRACLNFLKLCKIKYYNYNLFHTISRGFIAQTGDPTGTRSGGESIFGVIDGPSKKYFEAENEPRIKHTRPGLISFVGDEKSMIASQFFLTLGDDLSYLDEKHCVFGEVVEGLDILESINEVICDNDDRPFQDVRITHTVVLDDPYPDPKGLTVPSRSPSPSAERLAGGRIAPDEEIDETSGKSAKEIAEMQAEREAKARATILEMVGDIPDAEMAPPENVLFVCKLNPVTDDADLEIIFSRFGKIKSCEVIRDKKSGDSLQYAFIEFEDQKSCEEAYFKMDNVLVDDRRLHVDFSQSVSKVKWLGKGRGVKHFDEKGNKRSDLNNEIGKGEYKVKNGSRQKNNSSKSPRRNREKSRSPRRPENRSRMNKNDRNQSRSRSRSPERPRRRTRSPQQSRRRSTSPKQIRRRSRDRRENRRRQSSSPDHSPRRYDRSIFSKRESGSPRNSWNAARRSGGRYSPDRRSNFRRQRSGSPRRRNRSPYQHRREDLKRRRSRSPRKTSMSPEHSSKSPEDKSRKSREKSELLRNEKNISKEKHVEKKRDSSSPVRSRSPRILQKKGESEKRSIRSPSNGSRSLNRKNNVSEQNLSKSSREDEEKNTKTAEKNKNKEVKKQQSSNNVDRKSKDLKKKTRNKSKVKKRSLSKKKKSKKYDSSEESDSEEDKRKIKKKKSKKKVESSTEDSSSSDESSSSSEEEARKRRKRKKDVKIKKHKKTKKRRKRSSSSSSDSSSDSDSDSSSSSSSSDSSSESESGKNKKKRSKKKRTKVSSESD